MSKKRIINLDAIEKVALALNDINDEVIYVGGAIMGLYVTDKGAELPRPTFDIDISVQVSTYTQMDQLRERLARKKIFPEPSETVIYRYSYEGILIDFIPFEETPLGPTNKWFRPGFKRAYNVSVGKARIKILPVDLFLATKWEAFKNRSNDPRMSHDFEDIIYVIDNHPDLVASINKSDREVITFLKKMSREILSYKPLHEIIECHLEPYTAVKRREIIIKKLNDIIEIH